MQQDKQQLTRDLCRSNGIQVAQVCQLKAVSAARDALVADKEELRNLLERYNSNKLLCLQVQHLLLAIYLFVSLFHLPICVITFCASVYRMRKCLPALFEIDANNLDACTAICINTKASIC